MYLKGVLTGKSVGFLYVFEYTPIKKLLFLVTGTTVY